MRRDIQLYPPRREDPPPWWCVLPPAILCIGLTALAWLLLSLMCERAEAGTFEHHAREVIADRTVAEWKRDLYRQALAHNAQEEECRVSYYHPSESSDPKWRSTAIGTLVRPGVVAVHASRWAALGGAWVFVRGYGLAHVEDRDVYRSRQHTPWLDVAVPEAYPGQPYHDWLGDLGRVRLAKAFGLRPGTFVVVKPKGGWEQ